MRIILPFLFLIVSSISYGAENTLFNKIQGVYAGQIASGEEMVPVLTAFTIDKKGVLIGAYAMDEVEGLEIGALTVLKKESPYTVSMRWHDKYGTGTVRLLFSEDYVLFSGFWGYEDSPASLYWDGEKY